MKLTSITAQNFKGLNFSLTLVPITILVGKNFVGKTARLDAIRFLLLGYLPELGKINKATFQLASGQEMMVTGTFDDGTVATRSLKLKGDSIKAEFSGPKWLENTQAVMLDPTVYFGLGDRDRLLYVARNVPMPASDGLTIESLEAQIKETAEQEKTAKAFAKTMQETVNGIASLKTLEGEPEPGNLADLGRERHALANALQSLSGQIGKVEEQIEQQNGREIRRAGLIQQIELSGKAQAKLDDIKAVLAIDEGELAALGEVDDLSVPILALDQAQRAVNGTQKAIAAEEQLIELGKQNIIDLEGETRCPFCGAEGEGWRDISLRDIKAKIAKSEAIILNCRQNLAVEKEQLIQRHTELAELKAKRGRAVVLREQIKGEAKNVAIYEKTLGQLPAWQAEIANMPAPDPWLAKSLDHLQDERTAKETLLIALDHKIRRLQARENDSKRLAESEIQRDRAQVDQAKATAVLQALMEKMGQMVALAFGSLLEAANRLFGAILKSTLAYHEGEIGRWEGGLWISHATFSGAEKALAYAALQAALTQGNPVRIMLIDELGKMDRETREALLFHVEQSIKSDALDQFVGAGPSDVVYPEGSVITAL